MWGEGGAGSPFICISFPTVPGSFTTEVSPRLGHGVGICYFSLLGIYTLLSRWLPRSPFGKPPCSHFMNTVETINQGVLSSPGSATARPPWCYLSWESGPSEEWGKGLKKSLRALSYCKYHPEDPFSLVPGSPELVCFQALVLQVFLPYCELHWSLLYSFVVIIIIIVLLF